MTKLKAALTGLVLVALAGLAFGQTPLAPPSNRVTFVSASSGNVAAATATATLAAGSLGETTYICGFSFTGGGATAASVVNPTIAGLLGGTATYTIAVPAGATVAITPLTVVFTACTPASAPNTAITVSLPSLGAGNTNATANAWGYRLAAHD